MPVFDSKFNFYLLGNKVLDTVKNNKLLSIFSNYVYSKLEKGHLEVSTSSIFRWIVWNNLNDNN